MHKRRGKRANGTDVPQLHPTTAHVKQSIKWSVLVFAISGALIALVPIASASLTFTSNGITSDGSLNISGTGTSTFSFGGGLTVSSTAMFTDGPWVDLMAVGAKCDDATDDTSALNTALSDVYNQGGGTVVIPGGKVCLIDGQVTIPNDGQTDPSQKPIRITSFGNSSMTMGGIGIAAPNGGGALDLRYNSPTGKIDTRGAGYLEIDHVILEDKGSDCAPFIFDTNTVVHIHDNEFYGTASGTSACNDAIVLGGSGGGYGGTATSVFQGYGTVIQSNMFNQVQRAVFAQNDVNGIQIVDNTIGNSSGASSAAAIEFANTEKWDNGNYVAGNLIELSNYKYGIWFATGNASGNALIGNMMFDWDSTNAAAYRFESGASNNIIVEGGGDQNIPVPFSEASGTYNSYITAISSSTSMVSQPWQFNNLSINGTGTLLTNTPGSLLSIGGTSSASVVNITAQDPLGLNPLEIHSSWAEGINVYTHTSGASFRAPEIALFRSRGTESTPQAVLSGDALSYLTTLAYNGSAYSQASTIESDATQNWSGTANGDNMYFQTTANNSTSPVTRLLIDQNGNVGIGTTGPSTTLQVAGASSTIRIGASLLPGCLEMGNSDGSAGINYITVLNGVLSATTTKPSNCQ